MTILTAIEDTPAAPQIPQRFVFACTDASGEHDIVTAWAPDEASARRIASEQLEGTGLTLDATPGTLQRDKPTLPLLLLDVRQAMRALNRDMIEWQAVDERIAEDGNPYIADLRERDRCQRQVANDLQTLAKRVVAMLTLACADLPAKEQLRRSVEVEKSGVMRAAE